MKVNISELLDNMEALDVGLAEQQGVSTDRIKEMTSMKLHAQQTPRKNRTKRTGTVILVACLALALAVTAFAAARVLMKTTHFGNVTEISFQATDDDFIDLGNRLPQQIPDGYEQDFVSDPSFGGQRITYKNTAGNQIAFICQKAGSNMDHAIENVKSKETVQINANEGVFYTCEGYRILFWTDSAAGIGYSLDTDDPSVDLVAMAKSVINTDTALTPTRAASLDKALQELGDYKVTQIPNGYESSGTIGSPMSEGGGWYGYIRRVYTNKEDNSEMVFMYETYQLEAGTKDTPESVLALYGNGEMVSVSGMSGSLTESNGGTTLHWVDMEHHLIFSLSAENILAEDMIQIAQSVK